MPMSSTPSSATFAACTGEPRRVIIASWTPGARERLISLLADHGLKDARKVDNFVEVLALPKGATAFACFGVEEGFETPDFAVIAEQDILGDRLVRQRRKTRRAADVLTEATSLSVGDLVVHSDHGIGRFCGTADHHGARRAARLSRNSLRRR